MKTKFYQLVTASRILLGTNLKEFKHSKLLKINFFEVGEDSIQLEYNLVNQKMEGYSTIHSYIADFDDFQDHLVLTYKPKTGAIHLENHNELMQKWYESSKRKLQNKYTMEGGTEMIAASEKILENKSEFEKQLIGYSAFRTLFNPYINLQEGKHELSLPNYFGSDIDLDLILTSQLQGDNTILNTAEINESKFDKEALTKMVRFISQSFDIKVDVGIDMEEIYQFNPDKTPQKVDIFLDVVVVDYYYNIISAHQLGEITEENMLEISNQWKQEREYRQKHFSFVDE